MGEVAQSAKKCERKTVFCSSQLLLAASLKTEQNSRKDNIMATRRPSPEDSEVIAVLNKNYCRRLEWVMLTSLLQWSLWWLKIVLELISIYWEKSFIGRQFKMYL